MKLHLRTPVLDLGLFVLVVILVILVTACTDAPEPTSTNPITTVPATSATAPDRASTETTTTLTHAPVIFVEDLFDGGGARVATVSGFVVTDRASARLCGALLESYPAQCGGFPTVVIADRDLLNDEMDGGLDLEMDEAQGVAWTPSPVELDVTFDGSRVFLGDPNLAAPTADDIALVELLQAFAIDPSAANAAALPLADPVVLGLGGEPVAERSNDALADPTNWLLDVDEYEGYAGPFTALSSLNPERTGETTVLIGAHNRCVGAPTSPPPGFEDHRRISVQPAEVDGCLEWSSVDLFVGPNGLVEAISLELFGP